MKTSIDFSKSLQVNASNYFDKSKKAKKKLESLEKAAKDLEKKIAAIKEKKHSAESAREAPQKKRARQWFEKFRWFYSSDGLLVLGGRDAQSNEQLVKKYMEPDDVYFHAEIHGAPHVIVKAKKNLAPSQTMNEAAQFAAVFSSAWREKLASVDVYSVKPEQVSKKAMAGEALGTGAFMIYGQREWFKNTPLNFAIGFDGEKVVSGPESAVKKNAKHFVGVIQGAMEKGPAAKKIKALLEHKLGKKNLFDLDELVSMLPSGGIEVKD
ncbi:MAG: NFACT RNA binding domain-containing protein [Candidatus Diapherotrites archaeon]